MNRYPLASNEPTSPVLNHPFPMPSTSTKDWNNISWAVSLIVKADLCIPIYLVVSRRIVQIATLWKYIFSNKQYKNCNSNWFTEARWSSYKYVPLSPATWWDNFQCVVHYDQVRTHWNPRGSCRIQSIVLRRTAKYDLRTIVKRCDHV